MSHQQRQLLIRGVIFAALVVLLFLLSRYGPQPLSFLLPVAGEFEEIENVFSNSEKLQRLLISLGPYSSAVFILLQVLQVVAAPFPGELTGVVGGYLYGEVFGFILSTIGLTLGSWVTFELASILGRPFVEKYVSGEVLRKFDFVATNTGTFICFLLFVVPGFPKDYLCYVLGLSRMRLGTFLIVSVIGRLPGTYLLTLQGASLRSQEYVTAFVFAAISAVLLLIAYLYRAQLFHWVKSKNGR
ncbi:MAG: TVP38/TMEM64 family protein [Deltaproteobacteria bacterium]|nr:TVP38/TMEM64 family protein [Deltaproteobacteria bacterium]